MLIIPILVSLGFLVFGGRKFTLKKFALDVAVQALLMCCVAYGVSCQNTADTEILNGRVTSKTRDEVSCEHSYQCNCYQSCTSDGKGGESCTTICQTCYEHSYDVDWDVHTSIGRTIEIDRVDRQGLDEPPRWRSVKVGEPISVSHGFTNYVKGSPDTLFRHQGLAEKFKDKIPGYPGNIYDYYRLNRLVSVGLSVGDAQQWNQDLMEMNADLGAAKQVNAVVVVTKNQPEDYFYALEQEWIGGKKNDVVLVIDVDDAGKIDWTNVMAWTDNKIFQVALNDSVRQVGSLNREAIMATLRENISKNFIRKPMKDFEYLSGLIKPTTGQWIFAMVFGLALSLGLGFYLENNDIFNEEYGRRW
jgi:hypothetical protein